MLLMLSLHPIIILVLLDVEKIAVGINVAFIAAVIVDHIFDVQVIVCVPLQVQQVLTVRG